MKIKKFLKHSQALRTLVERYQLYSRIPSKQSIVGESAELVVLRSAAGIWLKRVRLLLLETNGYNVEREVIPLVEREGFYFRELLSI